MTTYVKIVKGATKIKVAAPKPKYIEPILIATADASEFKTVMSALYERLGDSAWSIVFKSLLVLHIMIREGDHDVTLKYLSKHPEFFELRQMKQNKTGDTKSLLRYAKYLSVRAKEFQSTKIDYVRDEQDNGSQRKGTRLKELTVDKGLLREVESVERQIESLLRCKFNEAEINNDIVLTCFRMLVNDLLCLFSTLNEGVINILEHYFEMSKYDAKRALEIYKDFVVLTADVVNYLRVAKHLEYATKLHVPTIRHAPTALAQSLEEYLNDTNFEVNRSQYLAEKEFKSHPPITKEIKRDQPPQTESQSSTTQQIKPQSTVSVSNPWFSQIQPMQVQFTQQSVQPVQTVQTTHQVPQNFQNPQVQQVLPQGTGNPFFQPQQTQQPQIQSHVQLQPLQSYRTGDFSSVPSASINPSFTGAGFGGFNSGITQQFTGSNPFVSSLPLHQQQQPQINKPLESSKTGNNPFALNYKSQLPSIDETKSELTSQNTSNPFSLSFNATSTTQQPLNTQSTGTNPFQSNYISNRISVNGGSGQHQRATFGGYENLATTPVFPQTIQEQRTAQFNQQAGFELQQQINQNKLQQQQLQFPQTSQFTGFNGQQFQQGQQTQPVQNGYTGYDGPSLI